MMNTYLESYIAIPAGGQIPPVYEALRRSLLGRPVVGNRRITSPQLAPGQIGIYLGLCRLLRMSENQGATHAIQTCRALLAKMVQDLTQPDSRDRDILWKNEPYEVIDLSWVENRLEKLTEERRSRIAKTLQS